MSTKVLGIDEIVQNLFKAGEKWVAAKTLHHRFQVGEKHKLASIKQALRKTTPPNGKKYWTRDDLEEVAYASQDWKTFIDDYNQATEKMLTAKNDMDSWSNAFEARRSIMATERTVAKGS